MAARIASRRLLPHAVCQALRIISFTVTQLPGPNYHCRGGELTAVREMPERWWGHVVVDLRRQVSELHPLIFHSALDTAESAVAVWSLAWRTTSYSTQYRMALTCFVYAHPNEQKTRLTHDTSS